MRIEVKLWKEVGFLILYSQGKGNKPQTKKKGTNKMNKEQFEELQNNLHSDFYEEQFDIWEDFILTIFKTNDTIIIDINEYLEGYEAFYQIHTDVTPLPDNVEDFNKLLDKIWFYNNIKVGE